MDIFEKILDFFYRLFAGKTQKETEIHNEEPVPSTGEEPVPSTGEEPVPSTGEEPVPSNGEEPVPSNGEEPVSSNIRDAIFEDATMDSYNPEKFFSLADMPVSLENGFFLLPGDYEMVARGYCLAAGTYTPRAKGDGYLYAPLKGSKSAIVRKILMQSFNHREIDLDKIQALLWAIVVRAKPSEMPDILQTANQLLTPSEVQELEESAAEAISTVQLMNIAADQPEPLRARRQIENDIRQHMRSMRTFSDKTFAELEKVCLLEGIAPQESFVRQVPVVRWSKLPQGYYIRYQAENTYQVRIQLSVPESAMIVGNPRSKSPELKPYDGVAVPGNTTIQRVGLASTEPRPDAIDKAKKATDKLLAHFEKKAITKPWLGHLFIPLFVTGAGMDYLLYDPSRKCIDALQGKEQPSQGNGQSQGTGQPNPAPMSSNTSNFQEHVIPKVPPQLEPFNTTSGTNSEKFNSTVDALLSTSYQLVSELKAYLDCQERLFHAQYAGSDTWVSEHARALCYYKRKAGMSMQNLAKEIETCVKTAQEEDIVFDAVTPEMIREEQEAIRKGESVSEIPAVAKLMEFADIKTDDIKAAILALNPDEAADNFEHCQEVAKESYTEMGDRWIRLPIVEKDW